MREKIRYRLTLLKTLRPFANGVKRFLLFNFITGLAVMILGFLQPVFYKLFIDQVILQQKFHVMLYVAIGYLSIFIMNTLLTYLKNYCTNRLVNRVIFRVKMRLLRGFFSQEFSSYEKQSVGDRKMRLDDDTSFIATYSSTQTVSMLCPISPSSFL